MKLNDGDQEGGMTMFAVFAQFVTRSRPMISDHSLVRHSPDSLVDLLLAVNAPTQIMMDMSDLPGLPQARH